MKRFATFLVLLSVFTLPLAAQEPVTASRGEIASAFLNRLADYGYRPSRQSFIFETMEGETLIEYGADRPAEPASVVKAATSLVALARLGPDYRFTTSFLTNGYVDTTTQTLKGDLIIAGGGDPSFYYENAFFVLQELKARGIDRIEGDLVVVGDFYLSFDTLTYSSAQRFKSMMNPADWSASLQRIWANYVQQQSSLSRSSTSAVPPALEITGGIRMGSTLGSNTVRLLSHSSSPLSHILKELNKYSNNTLADLVGRKVGGPTAIERYLIQELGLNPAEVEITSASGLQRGHLTARGTLRIYRQILALLMPHQLRLEDIFPVVGIDAGTLQERLDATLVGVLTGKTGTLPRTGVSALAGVVYTRDKGPVLFAIFNQGGNVVRFRRAQDELISDLLVMYGAAPLQYVPNQLSHLAQCRLEVAAEWPTRSEAQVH